MRPIPRIKFVAEEETGKADKIEKLLEEIEDN
jgi:ribosome-binding factor A